MTICKIIMTSNQNTFDPEKKIEFVENVNSSSDMFCHIYQIRPCDFEVSSS